MNVIIEYHLRVAYIQSLLQVDIEINGPYCPKGKRVTHKTLANRPDIPFLEKSECILCMKEICRYVMIDGLINKYLTYRQSNSLMVLKPHPRKYHGRGAKTLSVTRRPRASKHRTRRFTWSGNSPMIAKLKGDFTI